MGTLGWVAGNTETWEWWHGVSQLAQGQAGVPTEQVVMEIADFRLHMETFLLSRIFIAFRLPKGYPWMGKDTGALYILFPTGDKTEVQRGSDFV